VSVVLSHDCRHDVGEMWLVTKTRTFLEGHQTAASKHGIQIHA